MRIGLKLTDCDSAALLVGLLVMIWPPLSKVQWERLPRLLSQKRWYLHLAISFFINWIAAPLVMVTVAWICLPEADKERERRGIVLVGVGKHAFWVPGKRVLTRCGSSLYRYGPVRSLLPPSQGFLDLPFAVFGQASREAIWIIGMSGGLLRVSRLMSGQRISCCLQLDTSNRSVCSVQSSGKSSTTLSLYVLTLQDQFCNYLARSPGSNEQLIRLSYTQVSRAVGIVNWAVLHLVSTG